MTRFVDSLYARLALVLLLALAASYATMYFLFLAQLEGATHGYIARVVAVRVELVEELLRTRLPTDLPPLTELTLSSNRPKNATRLPTEVELFAAQLQEHLHEALGRPVSMVPSAEPNPGVWIELFSPAGEHDWLLVPPPRADASRTGPLIAALTVGFIVILGGGMMLLWQIQRPLKRLGRALENVGEGSRHDKLPIAGAGEVRALAERYNDMIGRLDRYEEDRATMLAGVAHDLRSPITRMRLLVELDQGPRQNELARNVDDIERITEQFLVYAGGGADERAEEHDAGLFAAEIVAPYSAQGVSLICAEEGLRITVRANALRRALINLIENALEYGQPPVIVRVARSGDMIVIGVEDAGPGIAPDQVARALRPFSRLDNARPGKGHCGLGLVIVGKIVAQHAGDLDLHQRDGGGFVAEIRIPVAAA